MLVTEPNRNRQANRCSIIKIMEQRKHPYFYQKPKEKYEKSLSIVHKMKDTVKLKSKESTVKLRDDVVEEIIKRPKIAITTSKLPSERLLLFIKELRLIFPNSYCLTRDGNMMSEMMRKCKVDGFTDLIVVHEYMEVPDSLVICHLPYGLTTSFTLSGVIMHSDMPVVAQMSDQTPHIVFNNFRSFLSMKIMSILQYLLPDTNMDSQRVITFTHEDGYISFRQHTHKQDGDHVKRRESGPRFQLKLIEMKFETPEALDAADEDWILRPYLNTNQHLRRLG
ncbi:U3 small nucleolar ribonucleoprotein protein IMP4-like [Aricia agestis]|uniref:U3 small nucleolar ribonucleoprotein protein IMP4-like n=1 Tax=Aricia agestis TaxID=91739 RepID=UPI001C20ACD5|nr:U3 small nucleolar ribonucleoprotein protein IMP4-like [Aricia agestis]